MAQKLIISIYLVSFLCILCRSANLEYSFNGESFNFSTWQQGSEGFQCPRDHQYVILCQFRWDMVVMELAECETHSSFSQCLSRGTSATLFTVIAIETIIIVALSLYVHKSRKLMKEKDLAHRFG